MDGYSDKSEIFHKISIGDERDQRKEKIKNMFLEIVRNTYKEYCIYVDNSGLDAIIKAQEKNEEAIIAFFSEDKRNFIEAKYIENIKKMAILKHGSRNTSKDIAETLQNAGQERKESFETNKQDIEKDIALLNELLAFCTQR